MDTRRIKKTAIIIAGIFVWVNLIINECKSNLEQRVKQTEEVTMQIDKRIILEYNRIAKYFGFEKRVLDSMQNNEALFYIAVNKFTKEDYFVKDYQRKLPEKCNLNNYTLLVNESLAVANKVGLYDPAKWYR